LTVSVMSYPLYLQTSQTADHQAVSAFSLGSNQHHPGRQTDVETL
jgi:hypothetical protein